MKKFLTVLLALSVVFTYTVGTAFAGTVTAQADEPYDVAMAQFNAKAKTVAANNAVTEQYDENAVEFALGKAYEVADAVAKVLIKENTNEESELNATAFYAAFNGWLNDDETVTDVANNVVYKGFATTYGEKVVAKDVELKVAAAKALVKAVKAADFIEEDQVTVESLKTSTLEDLATITKDSEIMLNGMKAYKPDYALTDISNYSDEIDAILYGFDYFIGSGQDGTQYIALTKQYNADSKASTLADADELGFFGKLENLTTIEEGEADDALTAEYIKKVMADLRFELLVKETGFYNTHTVEAGDAVTVDNAGKVYGVKVVKASKITADEATAINAALKAQIEVLLKQMEVRCVYQEWTKTTLLTIVAEFADDAFTAKCLTKADKAEKRFNEVEALAAKMKAEVNYIGEKMYNDADIDEAVANAKEEIYGLFFEETYNTAAKYLENVHPAHDPVDVALRAARAKWDKVIGVDKVAEADKKYCANFYSDATEPVNWHDEYATIRDEAKDALWEVKSIEEVEAIMADADAKLAALRTKADETAELTTEIARYTESLKGYAGEQWRLVKDSEKYSDDSFYAAYADGAELIASVAKVSDLTDAYAEAKALFKNIKTIEALDAEAAAVEKMIVALPDTATIEKEAEFMAAYDAYKAYLENYGAKDTDVTGYYALERMVEVTLKGLQEKAVRDAINDLADLAPITAEDKAAVEAVRAMFDKYNDYYEGKYDINFAPHNYEILTTAEDDVYFDEVEVVKHMIAKLTTASSIEDIAAAKAAYDALSGSQQRLVNKAFPYKMEMLKGRLIQAVESMKVVKAHSAAGKGYIKVMWDVVGDETAIDGFQVYKSTKAQTGYTFMGKTTKHYMTNKKGLKKGKRFYYKVRAYKVIDGTKYFSDWSNKANRIAK